MDNTLQREIDFAIHLSMLKSMIEKELITESEYHKIVSRLREKLNCKLIVRKRNRRSGV